MLPPFSPPAGSPDRPPDRPHTGARRGRTVAWAIGALALLAIGALAIAEARGWPFLRAPVTQALSQAAGVPVDFGDAEDRFALKLFGRPSLDVAALTVGAAPGPPAPNLLSGRDVRATWRWPDAWRWWRGSAPLQVASLDARTLDMHLLRDAGGRATWQIGAIARGEAPPPPGDAAHDDLPRIDRLSVGSGHIVVDDRPLATRLVVTVQGAEGSDATPATPVGWRAHFEGRWKALPLRLDVVAGGAMPLVADGAGADIGLRVEGLVGAARVLFDGRAGALLGARRLEGELTFGGPSLDRVGAPLGLTLPQTPPFELEGRLAHDAGVWQLMARRATIGKSRLGGEFRYDTRPELPMLTGKLTGSRLALADLGPAVGAPTGGAAAGPAASRPAPGRVLPRRSFDLPSLKWMDADVQVAIDELDFGTEALAPLRQVSSRVVLASGRLAVQQIQAAVAGGTVSGTSSYDSTTASAQWAARMRFAGVDIAGWLRGARIPQAAGTPAAGPRQAARLRQERQQARQGGDQVARHYVTGALDAEFDVRGSGDSTGEILSTLNGRFDLTLRDGTLSHLATEAAGLDLAQSLGVIVRGDRPLPLRCARIQATARNGIVRTDRGVIDNADSTIRLAGELNLKDESLALVATSRPKDFSLLSLRTPLTIRGTLAQPRVGVEGGALAAKAGVVAALGAALGPFAALIPLIDFGRQEEGDPCAAAGPTPPGTAASGAAAAATSAPSGR